MLGFILFILFNLLFVVVAYITYDMGKFSREEKIERNREINKKVNKPDSNDYSI
jgi:hypothetical protein